MSTTATRFRRTSGASPSRKSTGKGRKSEFEGLLSKITTAHARGKLSKYSLVSYDENGKVIPQERLDTENPASESIKPTPVSLSGISKMYSSTKKNNRDFVYETSFFVAGEITLIVANIMSSLYGAESVFEDKDKLLQAIGLAAFLHENSFTYEKHGEDDSVKQYFYLEGSNLNVTESQLRAFFTELGRAAGEVVSNIDASQDTYFEWLGSSDAMFASRAQAIMGRFRSPVRGQTKTLRELTRELKEQKVSATHVHKPTLTVANIERVCQALGLLEVNAKNGKLRIKGKGKAVKKEKGRKGKKTLHVKTHDEQMDSLATKAAIFSWQMDHDKYAGKYQSITDEFDPKYMRGVRVTQKTGNSYHLINRELAESILKRPGFTVRYTAPSGSQKSATVTIENLSSDSVKRAVGDYLIASAGIQSNDDKFRTVAREYVDLVNQLFGSTLTLSPSKMEVAGRTRGNGGGAALVSGVTSMKKAGSRVASPAVGSRARSQSPVSSVSSRRSSRSSVSSRRE